MHAFHSNWTKPFFNKHTGEYFVEDFELLTTILSALKWQELNGDIVMITDSIGANYYRKLGIEKVWNLGIDDSLESEMDDALDASTFWAAGKIYALQKQQAPCVMIDTDFIVWQPLVEELIRHQVSVIHREPLEETVYPEQSKLQMKPEYVFPQGWNWNEEACNTAFACFNEEMFRRKYVSESIAFMKGTQGADALIYMVFAEQRLLAMCASEEHVKVHALSNTEELFHSGQRNYTHIWGYKRYLRNQPDARRQFCKRCIERIKKDYPNIYPLLYGIESLVTYL